MTGPASDRLWRNRFILVNLVRIGGTAATLLGLVVWHGDLLREGGHVAAGLALTLGGLAVSFLAPQWLTRRWRTPPPPPPRP